MTNDLLAELLPATTGGLMLMPLLSVRVRNALRPTELTRFNAVTMTAGATLLLGALLLCAAPSVASLWNIQIFNGHFFAGDEIVGWVSAAAATAMAVLFAIGWVRTRRIESRLWVEPTVGQHEPRHGYDLVILPSAAVIAYAAPSPTPQVVVSTGLRQRLTRQELESVIEHEVAHLQQSHHRHLRFLGALSVFQAFGPIRRLIDSVRLGLEIAADHATSDRAATVSALAKLHDCSASGTSVAAFTAGDVAKRVDMLTATTSRRSSIRWLLYLGAVGLVAASALSVLAYWM